MDGAPAASSLTGQLGDVMKESAADRALLRPLHADGSASTPRRSPRARFHVHVPAGAVPKDGPVRRGHDGHRARVASLSGRPVRADGGR